jgi:hypothetical protein
MMNSSDNSRRGYFNALTSSYFKTGPDGRKFFFPWGIWGRGYLIPTEERYERMHGMLKIYMIAMLVLIIGTIAPGYYIAGVAVAAALMLFYAAWVPFLKRGLEPSEERMTMSGNIATQARIHHAGVLWALEIMSIAFVATGVAMLIFQPQQWFAALGAIVFFGYCAFVIGRMIMLRRREATGQA